MLELKISFGTFFGLRTRRILIDLTKVNDLSKYKADLSDFSDRSCDTYDSMNNISLQYK